MSKRSKRVLCREFHLVPINYMSQIRSVFTQWKTIDGIAENKTVEMRSFSENEIQKLKDIYGQKPGQSHAAWLVFLFDKGALQTNVSGWRAQLRMGSRSSGPHCGSVALFPCSGYKRKGEKLRLMGLLDTGAHMTIFSGPHKHLKINELETFGGK